MEIVDRLLAIEEIKNLKARYFRHIDFKEWEQYEALFAPDFVAYRDDGEVSVRGGKEFAGRVKALLDSSRTIHQGYMPEINILGETTASGLWVMEDLIAWPDGDPCGMKKMQGWGHYHETYVKGAEGWLIASLKLTRLRLDVEPSGPAGA
jgi:hypothetical protein